jgi:hypothetical protein
MDEALINFLRRSRLHLALFLVDCVEGLQLLQEGRICPSFSRFAALCFLQAYLLIYLRGDRRDQCNKALWNDCLLSYDVHAGKMSEAMIMIMEKGSCAQPGRVLLNPKN